MVVKNEKDVLAIQGELGVAMAVLPAPDGVILSIDNVAAIAIPADDLGVFAEWLLARTERLRKEAANDSQRANFKA